jgi:Spy/CpxP family protein refolding chaperone
MMALFNCELAEHDSASGKDNPMKKLIISLVALSAAATMATSVSAHPHWYHHHWRHHHWHHHW